MTEARDFLYLSDETLAGLGITATDVVDCIETTLRAQAEGKVWAAPKASILPGDGRYMMATLAASDTPRIIAVKSVMVSPRNPARGLAGINGAIMLLDSETGLLLAVMDANWVTAVRTAGLSAVVAKRLANPQSTSVAFVGCGVQAHSHLDAFAELFPLTEVRAFGRGRANVNKLCQAAREKGLDAKASASPREALEGADLIVSSITLAYDVAPFLDARWLKPGAFAAMTDLAIPWMPQGMTAFDSIIIDDMEQEAAMEKPMVDRALVSGDMTGLVTGSVSADFSADKCSAFVFRGVAVGDFALASLAYAKAAPST
jgi:ornithine cyclodeaminase/alanine dehydrogenase